MNLIVNSHEILLFAYVQGFLLMKVMRKFFSFVPVVIISNGPSMNSNLFSHPKILRNSRVVELLPWAKY